MDKFIVRVELHEATYNDYKKLHDEMYKEKFYKVIGDTETNEWFELPTAEYHIYSDLHINDVTLLAEKVALRADKSCSILVTESAGIRWINLKPIKLANPVLPYRI